MSSRTPSRHFTNISAAPLVCILFSFVIIDSTYANTVTESIFPSMFFSSHFNAKLTSFINASNPATFMRLNSCYSSCFLKRCKTVLCCKKVLYFTPTPPAALLSFCSERRNLSPGSKCIRLCLACQAVKNMFTSGSRSYSGLISSLARRNLPRM